MANPEIPYFIKVGGCINCQTSKDMKAKTGKEYGFDHELMVTCLLFGCHDQGFSIIRPYIDPAELVRFAKEKGDSNMKDRAREICLALKERFGEFYDEQGISIDEIIEDL